MSRYFRSPQLVGVLAASIMMVACSAVLVTGVAAADVTCSDGSRASARDIAASGSVAEPVPAVTAPSLGSNDNGVEAPFGRALVKLRYSEQYQCGWALIEGGSPSTAWIERSSDGGRTWDGRLGEQEVGGFGRSAYSGAFKTFDNGQVYSIRACGHGYHQVVEADLRSGHLVPGISNEPGPTVCTEAMPADWTVVKSFTAPDGSDLPLRLGRFDTDRQDRLRGFGMRHILSRHIALPDEDLIKEALAFCEPSSNDVEGGWDAGTTFKCDSGFVTVVYSSRVDYEVGGGQVVGIITAFHD